SSGPEYAWLFQTLRACHLDRRRRSEAGAPATHGFRVVGWEAPEEEWRDPENPRAELPIQGTLPECHSPEPPQFENVTPKLVWGPSRRHIEFTLYALERACAAWVERLVSASQRTHSRDLSTPLPSPARRDPSESVEMTARGGYERVNRSFDFAQARLCGLSPAGGITPASARPVPNTNRTSPRRRYR